MEGSYPGSSGCTLVKGSPSRGWPGTGTSSPGEWLWHQICQSSRKVWRRSWTHGVGSDTPARSRGGCNVSLPMWDSLWSSYVPRIPVGDFFGTGEPFFCNLNLPADTRKSINVQWKNCVEMLHLMLIKDFTYKIFTWCKEICMWQILWSVEISKSVQ